MKKIFTYNPDFIFNKSGVTKITKKIAESELTIFALKNIGENDSVVGYSKMKICSDRKNNVNCVLRVKNQTNTISDYVKFEVKEKKRCTQKPISYVPVGENKYIGVIKSSKSRVIFPLLILLILSAFLYFGLNPHSKPEWFPNIDGNIGVHQKSEDETKVGSIKANGFTKWIVPAGQTKNISVPLTNPAENRCYFQFTITLDETGEVLYESQLVPPSEGIYLIDISRPLEAGIYSATIFISTTDVETGGKMNSCKMKTTIVCQ